MKGLFDLTTAAGWVMLSAAVILLLLLVISFHARSYVFCQYLKTMTGIALRPKEVKSAFKRGGKGGVRELFLDLIIREDLKGGPVAIPEDAGDTREDLESGPVAIPEDAGNTREDLTGGPMAVPEDAGK